jgi:DNA-binding response OmpR family regulator
MRVLVVEDDPIIADAVCRAMAKDGHSVDHVNSAEKARAAFHAEDFDLAILDIGLPRENGLQLLRDLRRKGRKLLVLMLTARDGVNDRVTALDWGADDYLSKPFQLPELLARCRALARRANGLASAQLVVGTLALDLGHKELAIGGVPVELTQREWSILECLALNAGHIVSKDKLLTIVSSWGEEVTPNAVEVYVSRLRAKLGEAAVIHAIRGLGYRLDEHER